MSTQKINEQGHDDIEPKKRKGFLHYAIVAPARFLFVKMPFTVMGIRSIKNNNDYIKSLVHSIRAEPIDNSLKTSKSDVSKKTPADNAKYSKVLFWISICVGISFVVNMFFLAQNMRFYFSKGNWIVNIAFGFFMASFFIALRYSAYIAKSKQNTKSLLEWLISAVTFKN